VIRGQGDWPAVAPASSIWSQRTSSHCRSQPRSSSCGPFTEMSNLPTRSVVAIVVPSKAHLAHVSTLHQVPPGRSPCGIRPVIPTLPSEETARAGSASCCLSATGIGFLGHPVPATGDRRPLRSAHRDQPASRTRAGLPRSTCARPDRRGCRLDPGAAVLTQPVSCPRPPPAASQRPALHRGTTSIHPGLTLTRCHRRFTHVHPSGLPLTCRPRMERGPLRLLPRHFAPRRYQRRTPGWGRAVEHLPGLRHRRHRRPPHQRAACASDFVSHHLTDARRSW